jgi:hypothetical protein
VHHRGVLDTGTSGKFTAGVVDTGGTFATGVVDTGGKFPTGAVDTGGAPCLANISANSKWPYNFILRGLGEDDS